MYFFISRYQRELRRNSKKLIQNQNNSENSMTEEILFKQEQLIRNELIRLLKEQQLNINQKHKTHNFSKKNNKCLHEYYDPELDKDDYSIEEIINELISEKLNNEQNENYKRELTISKLSEFKYKYTGKHMKRIEKECAICLNEFNPMDRVKMFSCEQHIFHKECIMKWLKDNDFCPLCKIRIKY